MCILGRYSEIWGMLAGWVTSWMAAFLLPLGGSMHNIEGKYYIFFKEFVLRET